MCKIVGIDPSLVRANNEHSGGGQYLIKGVSSELFEKAELDAVKLYKYLVPREPFYEVKFKGDYPIQKWTAGNVVYFMEFLVGWTQDNRT